MSRKATLTDLLQFESDDFRFDEHHHVLGSGSFGEVWLGRHIFLNRDVAIKFNKFSSSTDRQFITDAIKEEIKHQKQVNHENIVQILGWVKLDSSIGIVMEYCNLGSLKTLLLDKRIEIGLPLQVQLILYIAKALACCHNLQGKRLIHVDVKPENILLAGLLVIKLCDFGSAEMSTWTELLTADHSTRSKKNRPQYTPYYTAPEKLKDLAMRPKKELDIYALGIIIYMFLTREMPYPRCNEEEFKTLLDAIKEGLRPNCEAIHEWKQTLNDNDKKIAEALEVLMKKCWHQDPTLRPSMSTICDRLQGILSQQRKSTLLHQTAKVLERMEELYPPPTNLKQRLTLHQLWMKKYTSEVEVRSTPEEMITPPIPLPRRGRPQPPASAKDSDIGDPTQRQTSGNTREQQTTYGQETQQTDKVDPTELIKRYVELLTKRNYSEAQELELQLSRTFQGLDATAEELKITAGKKKDEGKHLESILFHSLASALFACRNDIAGARGVRYCAWGLNEANEALLGTPDLFEKLQNKQIVRDHVIPLMQKMKIKIRNMRNVDEEVACEQEVWCLYCIEFTQRLTGDEKSREETIKLGLEMMEKQFGDDAGKYKLYGTLLNNLGWVYEKTNRLKESEDFYERAISSKKTATDFTEKGRSEWIEKSETNLRNVKLKLRQ